MKRIYFLFLLALLPLAAYADAVEIDGIYYNLNSGNNTAEVTSNPNNYSGAVSIPATVTYGNVEYNVTSIGNEAFIDCSDLTSVNIPNSVNNIGETAFWGCSSITHIDIPDGLTSIKYATFKECSGLVSVTIPEGVNILEEDAFSDCASLASVNLPNSLTTIDRGAFNGCSGLTSIVIPQNVTSIGETAFDGCSSLTSITILSKNITIGYALDNLPNLHELIIKADEITISFDGNDYDIKDVYCYAESDKIEWDGVGFRENTKFHVIDKTNYKAKFPQAQCTFDDFPLIYDGIKYVISDNSAHVVANTDKYKGNIEIAASVELNSVSYPVVAIDNEAFYDCGDLSSIIIPNSVTHIGDYAFEGCFDLASLSISNNLISIGEAAFADCYNLLTLTIPNSTNSIAKEAFAGCSGLTSVTVENNTPITITSSVFSNIANATLYVPAGSKAAYQAADYWKEFNEIIEFEPVPTGIEVIDGIYYNLNEDNIAEVTRMPDESPKYSGAIAIPATVTYGNFEYNVTSIGSGAFEDCSGLTSITIPNGVTSIGKSAFSGCSGLTSITIPTSVTSIGSRVFAGCSGLSSLNVEVGNTEYDSRENCNAIIKTATNTLIYGTKNTTIPTGVTSIGNDAFFNCSGLTSIIIPNSVTSIGSQAFYKCSGLTSITIPNSVTSIGIEVFSGCSGLTSVTIPNSVTSIGNEAFYKCSGLTSITIPNSVTSIGNEAFDYCSGLTSIIIPNSVTFIGNNAFGGCSGLTSITIPNSVTSIGDKVFKKCSGLTSITIPNSVTSIGDEAFNGCSDLTSVIVEVEAPITISEDVFSNRANATLYVPVGSKAAYQAADYWKEFNEIIERATPSDMFVFTANPDGITCSVTGFTDYCVGDVTIPESWEGLSVTSIGDMAFQYCDGLTSVTIPSSVTSIGEYAFEYCSGLTSVIIPQSVNSIGEGAFANCSNLASLSVEIGNTRYDSRGDCNAIIETETNTLISGTKNTVIPNSVTSIVLRAFYGCSGLTSITIPRNVTSIENQAFDHCSGLASLSVEAGNTRYDSRGDCNAIIETETNILICGSKNTVIPNDVTSIGDYAFSGCSDLTSVTIPNSVFSINEAAFFDCSSLTSVTIPNSVTYIGHGAFQDCGVLSSVTIPNNVTYIGNNAFSECFEMTSVTIPNTVTHIGNGAFYNYNLTSVTVEKGTPVNIKEYTFSNRANATLYVPVGSKATYEAAAYWNEFKEIVEIGMDLPADEIFSGTNLWAGYVAQEDLIPGPGLKVYVITNLGTTKATASQIDYMPQGVPVLLRRDNTTISSYEVTSGTGTAPTKNLLRVFSSDRSVSNREGFILYNDEFVLVNEGVLPAGRVFLPANNLQMSGGLTRSIVIDDDDATGIEGDRTVADDADEQWFDLQGRRLEQKPTKKGIYILNGRKVVVK